MVKNIKVYNPNSFKRVIFRLLPVALPVIVATTIFANIKNKKSDYDVLKDGWHQSYTYEGNNILASQYASKHTGPENTIDIEYMTEPTISKALNNEIKQYRVENINYHIEKTDQEITEELINNILAIKSIEELNEMVNYLGGEYYYQSELDFTTDVNDNETKVELHIYNTSKSNSIDEDKTYYRDLESSIGMLALFSTTSIFILYLGLMPKAFPAEYNELLVNKTVEGKKQKEKVK